MVFDLIRLIAMVVTAIALLGGAVWVFCTFIPPAEEARERWER